MSYYDRDGFKSSDIQRLWERLDAEERQVSFKAQGNRRGQAKVRVRAEESGAARKSEPCVGWEGQRWRLVLECAPGGSSEIIQNSCL